MGRVRAAGFRQRDLREAAGQHRRPAQGDRNFVFQGSGCRLGETGNPGRPQGHWHGSVWPVGYSNQHYGKAISTFRELNKAPGASRGLCCAADSPLFWVSEHTDFTPAAIIVNVVTAFELLMR